MTKICFKGEAQRQNPSKNQNPFVVHSFKKTQLEPLGNHFVHLPRYLFFNCFMATSGDVLALIPSSSEDWPSFCTSCGFGSLNVTCLDEDVVFVVMIRARFVFH